MGIRQDIALKNRYFRHFLFWVFWVAGFTFVKSYGAGPDVYLGWLTYYIVTLPVFITHTYLIVYWAAGKFLSGYRILVFIIIFFMLMVLFSFLEMIITSEILSGFFPYLFTEEPIYLNPGEVVISGIGNLYVILVFAASKMIRSWHIKEKKKQDIIHKNLLFERADVNAGIHPRMLLFSLEEIEALTSEGSELVPSVIFHLSELLNTVMRIGDDLLVSAGEELKNVRKLLNFYALLLSSKAPEVKLDSAVSEMMNLSASIVFLPLEILIRHLRELPGEMILISVHHSGFVKISWYSDKLKLSECEKDWLLLEMEEIYPQRFSIEYCCQNHQSSLLVRHCNVDTRRIFPNAAG